ncbi:MAG: serine/threonine protein phosphatase [Myxococcales bacterium]|nr:serine/threonine protein phosphatase [Myxococcales bacterium]
MIRFSSDPDRAAQQMDGILFYLTTFGYVDGDFDESEKEYVRGYIRKLARHRVKSAHPEIAGELLDELTEQGAAHALEIFERIDQQVSELFTEAVAGNEDVDSFVQAKLKLRCFEIFKSFDRENQEVLLDAMDELIEADGDVHPAELKLRNELVELFESDLGLELEEIEEDTGERVTIHETVQIASNGESPPFFRDFEFHYSADPEVIRKQVEADRKLLDQTLDVLADLRAAGAGKLAEGETFASFTGQAPFLDGHVYVHPVEPGARYDVTVLGDLHGCYSCLKAATVQTNFLEKVRAYKRDPENTPKPLLVFLGDYIDRGLFSLNGVFRAVLRLFVAAPEHVFVLRGNHEYYIEYQGRIFGGVKPAEAINTLKPHLDIDVFRHYRDVFEALPNMLALGKTLFVHGGIPKDRTLKEKWTGLPSLNDETIRFEMMWSDPSSADVIPAALQEQSARFPFGKLQAAAFLKKIGCEALVRGHEKVNEGFRIHYDEPQLRLATVFSAGGFDNNDLPLGSSYRTVTPKGLRIEIDPDGIRWIPFVIDYETYNDPTRNAFFERPPEIEHRAS